MFKQATATILLLAFVAQTFSAPFIRLDYYFNKADYEKNCINKARPMMHCNGKCQVMKKIREEEKKEQQNEERKINAKVETLSSRSFYLTCISEIFYTIITRLYAGNKTDAVVSQPRSVFHPPSA